MSAATLKALRKIRNTAQIEEGTVLRFKVTFAEDAYIRDEERAMSARVGGQVYTYTAIYLHGLWYTSARISSELSDGSRLTPQMNQIGIEAVLRSPQVGDVEVATAWETV